MITDWRGVAINEGDRVVWASNRYDGDRDPRAGRVTRVNETNNTVTVKREQPELRWKGEGGSSNLPARRVTRVDELPVPEAEKGLVAI